MAKSGPARRLHTLQINEHSIPVEPGETVLQAALRAGLDFPNSCRVGGCGACKCRLKSGDVEELTETDYLLSREELDARTVLACQSVPRSDVRVEVELATSRRVAGRVVGRERLTHDTSRIDVRLDGALAYKAGQSGRLKLEGVDVARSYSFATPALVDGVASFLVRRVPGGLVSTLLNEDDVVGRAVRLEGPDGDFWLRPGDAPLLFAAGGSGLAPILAMLKQALAEGTERPATLLFGARQQRDLYLLDELAQIASRWPAPFRFVPVLSEEPADSDWQGARGLLTDVLSEHLLAGAHAYLCGPPAMIDSATERLAELGVPRAEIRADRFTTAADSAPASEPSTDSAPLAGALHYLKYFLFHGVGLAAAVALVAGGRAITAALLGVLALYILGDALLGDDTATPRYRYPSILTAQLWLALPLLVLIVFCSVWGVSTGDPLGLGALVHAWTGYDALAARDATTFGHHVSSWVLTGLMIGMVGTIPAHELTHRTWDRVSMGVGRWLLAFSFDTSFAIEHVYGHHRYVSTREDPATAPRGRNVYFHIVASTVRGNVSAWRIEAARLAKRGRASLSARNAFLRGHAMSVLLVAAAWAMGGWRAAAFFSACALWGKALLEIVNYMEHYGIVRDPSAPVQPRHSWNTNRRVSSWTMFNLTRHSHHHAQGEVPYHELAPYTDAPMMINGYLTTIVVALIPPLWHALMTPKVLAWDRDYASEGERVLAARASAESGLRSFSSARAPSLSASR